MVMVEAPEGMDVPTESLAASQPNEDAPRDVPGDLQPSDWNMAKSATTSSSLGIAMGSVALLVLLGSVGSFAWMKWHEYVATSEQVADITDELSKIEIDDAGNQNEGAKAEVDAVEETVESDAERTLAAKPIINDPILISENEPPSIFETSESDSDALVLAEKQSALESPPDSSSTKPIAANPIALSDLASLLSGNPNEPALALEVEALAKVEEVEAEAEIATGTMASKAVLATRSNPEKDDIAKKLEERVRAIRFDRVPLNSFARSMMRLSGVPMQIDPAALEQTAQVVTVPVSVAVIDQSILQILKTALKPIGMVPVVENNAVRFASPRVEDRSTVQTSFYVGDLRSGKGRDLDLATLISTLIDPTSWSNAGGAGTVELKGEKLNVTNTRLVAIRTLVLLEKLRAARGLSPRAKLASHLTSLEPSWFQLHRFMRRRVNLDVWSEMPFSSVIEDMEEATGVRLIVDWSSLAKVNIQTRTPVVLHARDIPAETLLEQFLLPRGLALVPVDEKTFQVTTVEVADQKRYLEFYSFQQLGIDGMATVETLMLNGSAALDFASEYALVVGDSETHRQLSK